MEQKLVTSKNLKVGQEIKGTKDSGWHRMFSGIVKSINAAYVTIDIWGKGEREEKNRCILYVLCRINRKGI